MKTMVTSICLNIIMHYNHNMTKDLSDDELESLYYRIKLKLLKETSKIPDCSRCPGNIGCC